MDKVRWGVLSTANIGVQKVLPAMQRSERCAIVAIASRDEAAARAVAARLGIPKAYGSYDALLADPEIDAIYNPLPNHLHVPWTIKAIEAGKHVLCEKPLTRSVHEAEQMLEACQQAGAQLMEAAMYRFHPRMRRLKELLTSGALGSPRFLHSAFSFPLRDAENYRNSLAYGGGALLDIGCYCANALCWLNGASPVTIQAFSSYREAGGIDLESSALLRFANGSLGHMQCSFVAAEYQSIEIVGSQGALVAPLAFTAWRDDATLLHLQEGSQFRDEYFAPADPYQLMVEHFADVLHGEATPAYPPQEAVQTLAVLDAIRVCSETSPGV